MNNLQKNLQKDFEEVRKYQLKHFKVTFKRSNFDKREFALQITHNGFQWDAVCFISIDEMKKVAKLLQKKIAQLEK